MSVEILHPRLTERLVGHEAQQKAFLESFYGNKLHHAWLLTGPEGVGKATFAYHCAKFLLEQGETTDSDSNMFGDFPEKLKFSTESQSTHLVASESHPDLRSIEKHIDDKTGKSKKNISVEQVRGISQFFSLTPSYAGWRIIIVDTADDMNVSAANALLKILEEPPEKSILFLISHNPGKLLPTLRSRCRALKFDPLAISSVEGLLEDLKLTSSFDYSKSDVFLASGCPGKAIRYAHDEAGIFYNSLLQQLQQLDTIPMSDLIKFSEGVASTSEPHKWNLFTDFLLHILNGLILRYSTGKIGNSNIPAEDVLFSSLISTHPLEHWLELWNKLSTGLRDVERLNLDKKQVTLSSLLAFRAS